MISPEQQEEALLKGEIKMSPNIEFALKSAIEKENDERKKENTTFHASSLGMCTRKQVLTRANVKPDKPISIISLFKMRMGSVIGRDVQELLEKQGYLLPDWTEKREVYRSVSGKIDGYTLHVDGGAIVEIKTTDDRAIKYPDLPEHYLWQGFFYCIAFDVPRLLIFQIGKNQGLSRHEIFTITDKWRERIDHHIAELTTAWSNYGRGIVPAHDHRYKWEDKYCPYE